MTASRPTETVAVLGASPNPERYSFKAVELLREHGHRPIPINPAFDEILGASVIRISRRRRRRSIR